MFQQCRLLAPQCCLWVTLGQSACLRALLCIYQWLSPVLMTPVSITPVLIGQASSSAEERIVVGVEGSWALPAGSTEYEKDVPGGPTCPRWPQRVQHAVRDHAHYTHNFPLNENSSLWLTLFSRLSVAITMETLTSSTCHSQWSTIILTLSNSSGRTATTLMVRHFSTVLNAVFYCVHVWNRNSDNKVKEFVGIHSEPKPDLWY